jgi:hypothetical protein
MCYTCGCKQPFADHGDPRNITEGDLMESTKTKAAGGADISKVKENIAELIRLERQSGEVAQPKSQY